MFLPGDNQGRWQNAARLRREIGQGDMKQRQGVMPPTLILYKPIQPQKQIDQRPVGQ
jgi:hypothetical protein